MKKYFFMLIVMVSCNSEQIVPTNEVETTQQTIGIPHISVPDNNSAASGSSAGPHMISYTNSPLTSVITELSNLEVQVLVGHSKRVTVEYSFPNRDLEEAKSICLKSVLDAFDLIVDTISHSAIMYELRSQNLKIYKAEKSEQVTVKNNTVSLQNASISRLKKTLNKYSDLDFTVDNSDLDACCIDLDFNSRISERDLLESIKGQGISVQSYQGNKDVLHVSASRN